MASSGRRSTKKLTAPVILSVLAAVAVLCLVIPGCGIVSLAIGAALVTYLKLTGRKARRTPARRTPARKNASRRSAPKCRNTSCGRTSARSRH